ncbi:GIY-YIG nuclease family protein [Acidicapsa dinghuensis]|uniref:GIY-YIG nuclease family protein n=1 Tax=Acidicapsa dinghuensis TaxID=2218256 RepID=A0ABW1EKT9_9BACT|nr:GIY-YIG nuclease family protein [Acidicapsa dinghuensis]
MPKSIYPDFELIKKWPREFLGAKNGNQLLIRQTVSQLERPGVYILYHADTPVYVGRATRLISRLHSHANKTTSKHFQGWNFFSAFVLVERAKNSDSEIALLEAVLIAAIPGIRNGAVPRFNKVVIPKEFRKILQEIV